MFVDSTQRRSQPIAHLHLYLDPLPRSLHFFCIRNAKGKKSQGWNVTLFNLPRGISCSSIYFALQEVPTDEKG